MLIGVLHAFGILIFPKITLVLVFLVMAVVLVVRPHGLMGASRRPGQHAWRCRASRCCRRATPLKQRLVARRWRGLAGCCRCCSAIYALSVLTELVILALFAASLHFIMGPGGLASFGHAAYFGLGAYGAALAAKWLAAPMAAGAAGRAVAGRPRAASCSAGSACGCRASISPC